MIKALLVEDESITRKGLLKHIQWSELGVDEIHSAEDAETALKMSEDYIPDIIISDIKMRGIDGIDMCRSFKERFKDCQVIFISSYAQKEYFKAAIELEAIQYVEKPIDLEELSTAIHKAVERYHNVCEQRSMQINYKTSISHIKNETFFSLLRDKHGDDNDARLRIAGFWNDMCQGFRICIIRFADIISNSEEVKQWYREAARLSEDAIGGIHVYTNFLDAATMILYIASENSRIEEKEEPLKSMYKLVQEKENLHFLAIGDFSSDTKDLYRSYQSALQALRCLSFLGYGMSATMKTAYTEWLEDLDQEEENALRKAIQQKNLQEVEKIVEQIFDRYIKDRVILNIVVRNVCLMIYNYIRDAEKNNTVHKEQINIPSKEYTYILEQAVTLQEMKELLLRYARRVLKQENICSGVSNVTIKQVISYMHKHYYEKNLSINRMAEKVFLTPTYLSNLFKQDTGMTINQYLTRLRIDYAKTFLLDPKFKLYQVADKVGYEDAAYFTRIFKNQTGMSPSEYKEKNIL